MSRRGAGGGRRGYDKITYMSDPRSKSVPASWSGPLNLFCQWLRASGRSPETVKLRRAHVAQMSRAIGVAPADVTRDELFEWLGSRHWARESRRAMRASLKQWWEWFGRSELLDGLPKAPADVPSPRPAPDAALEAAFRTADDRTRLMLRLAAELGLRRGEISRVHASDVGEDLFGPTLRVLGKGEKVRVVPMSPGLAAEVRLRAGRGWLFPGDDGGHLSAKWVGTLMARALPDPWSAHTLRHRFATRAYGATADLMAVSRLLGHASVATTQRYVATDGARLRAVMAAAA